MFYPKWVEKWLKLLAGKGMSVMVLTNTFLASFSLPGRTASIQLFILAGQSNMVGYRSNLDDLPPYLQEPLSQVLWYDRQNEWVTLQAPTEPLPFSQGVANSQGFGPEITLAATISRHLKQPIALVKYAQNGTNLETQWNPKLEDSLYHQMLDRVQQAIAELSRLGYSVEIAGFFWMQGESDAKSDRYMASNYAQNFTHFIARLRQDLNQPELPVIYGLIPIVNQQSTTPFGTFEYGDIVRQAQFQVSQSVAHTRLVETLYFSRDADNLHFHSLGLMSLGHHFALQWVQMKCGFCCFLYPSLDWTKPSPALFFEPLNLTGRQCLDSGEIHPNSPITAPW
ncbi:sialate O-acetylesterase [Laspinema olomoucense]|uniref:Sialate O-acetylesterase n=1 Tax=Laspinema olomoucense D3b TaxID=2953688 RepID=A0ABT2NG89_9CYAN|nr:sialate O-acetylesterase [Laspinema sp. D3b]MCT7980286.1 sialate O-acetylesterase [Laspinema sp. D3b]